MTDEIPVQRKLPPLKDVSDDAGDAKPRRKVRKKKKPEDNEAFNDNEDTAPLDADLAPSQKKRRPKKKHRSQRVFDGSIPPEFALEEEDIVDGTLAETRLSSPAQPPTKDFSKSLSGDTVFLETRTRFVKEKTATVQQRLNKTLDDTVEDTNFDEGSVGGAMLMQRITHFIGVMLMGILAGVAVFDIVIVSVLFNFGREDFIIHYQSLAFPMQSTFYVLLVICLIVSLDMFDIEKPAGGYLRSCLSCQAGGTSSIMYLIALIITCVNTQYEDKIHLLNPFRNLWYSNYTLSFIPAGDYLEYDIKETSIYHTFRDDENILTIWIVLNIIRCVFCILGWVFISPRSHEDQLYENLEAMEFGAQQTLKKP